MILLVCCPYASPLNPSLDVNQYAHTAWTVREGFFKGTINAITQTPEGYLWLGTEFGLLRFDGVRSVQWQPPEGQHLPSSYIRTLLAARDGRLWIGTDNGLASWKGGKLNRYSELAGQILETLLEDRAGTVWTGSVATPGRLCAIESDSVRCYGEDGSFGRGVLALLEDGKGNLWAGAETGLWRWKVGRPKLYAMPGPVPDQALIEDHNGVLLLALRDGVRQRVNGKPVAYPLPGTGPQFKPNRLLQNRSGGLWIGTQDQGLLHVHQGRTDRFARSDGLSADAILSLFEDREGNVWVVTRDGLDRFREFAVPTISAKQGLSSGFVASVLAAGDGSVWVGTSDGLKKWKDSHITSFRVGNGLPNEGVQSLFQDHIGRIWVSTLHGVAYFEDGRFIPVNAVPGGNVHSITEDSAENLWISRDRDLLHLLGRNVLEQTPWERLGRNDEVVTFHVDPARGGLWLGFFRTGGAYLKDGQLHESYAGADALGEGRIGGLQLDRDVTLWAATQGGLSRVKNGRVATLSSRNRLPCDAVDWVVEDDAHSFWLGMACGLVRIARPELEAWAADPRRPIQEAIFDSSDGVTSHAFASGYSPRVSKSKDGRLWFS